jgi:L-seryl-tRNA(Ser) seleniumtransferase
MLPPRSNLRRFFAEGADLVTFSGGKAIGAPAASGILAGRRDLILSATAQQQDMYVRPASWPGPQGGDSAELLPEPPQQPVGRIVKVGREEVVGLIVALRRYLARDPAPDLARWQGIAGRIATAIDGVAGARTEIIAPEGGVPVVAVGFPALTGAASVAAASTVIARLRDRDPRVWAGEEFVDDGRVALNVQHVRDDEVQVVIDRLLEILPTV